MKRIEVSDEAYASLQRLADARHLTVTGLLATLAGPSGPALAGDALLLHLASLEFARSPDNTGRYLDLLAWCARNYATDFADFVSHQESGRHYLGWSREEINEARTHNHARQIDGTQFWAVMSIDEPTRRQFVCRLLEFIGCHDETVAAACRALGFATPPAAGPGRLIA